MQSLSSALHQLCSPSGRIVLWELWPLERTNSWVPNPDALFWLKIGRSDLCSWYNATECYWHQGCLVAYLEHLPSASFFASTLHSLKFLHPTGDPDILVGVKTINLLNSSTFNQTEVEHLRRLVNEMNKNTNHIPWRVFLSWHCWRGTSRGLLAAIRRATQGSNSFQSPGCSIYPNPSMNMQVLKSPKSNFYFFAMKPAWLALRVCSFLKCIEMFAVSRLCEKPNNRFHEVTMLYSRLSALNVSLSSRAFLFFFKHRTARISWDIPMYQ